MLHARGRPIASFVRGARARLYIGRREERHFELAADRLVLTETWTQSGVAWSGVRVLRRVR
jgi:hypothetical protein